MIHINKSDWQLAPFHVGQRIFAIGDIHGQLSQLRALEKEINPNDIVIYLGDYIDRSEESFATLAHIHETSKNHPERIYLPGNHEQMLLLFLLYKTIDYGHNWLLNGGIQSTICISKYRFADNTVFDSRAYSILADDIMNYLEKLSPGIVRWLQGLPCAHIYKNYVFVHAGLPVFIEEMQQIKGLTKLNWLDSGHDNFSPLWARKLANWVSNVAVVHGHSTVRKPTVTVSGNEFERYVNINIDTKAFSTGNLTMLELFGHQMRFISTRY